MKRRCCFNFLVLSAFCVIFACALCSGSIIYVDANAPNDPSPNNPIGSDPDECGSYDHPFDTIQKAIDVVEEGGTILVLPGSYPDADQSSLNEIDFKNKNFTLRSTDPNNWEVVNSTIINGAVYFGGSEDPNCRLLGFKIHNINYGAVYGENTRATMSNCNISGNVTCNAAVLMDFDGLINNCLITDNNCRCGIFPVVWGCGGIIRNCTIANNVSGITVNSAVIENTIIYNNQGIQLSITDGDTSEISYCNIQGLQGIADIDVVNWGPGNIDVDPCFISLGQWDMGNLELDEGDYHLKSYGWRMNRETPSIWLFDPVTSRCIDSGNPGYGLKNEPMAAPNDPKNDYATNIRINMGAYGGTHQASLAPYDWSLLADINNDGVVDFEDISLIAQAWLGQQQLNPGDLNRDEAVNLEDYALLGLIWQKSTDWVK